MTEENIEKKKTIRIFLIKKKYEVYVTISAVSGKSSFICS